jgi:hypothetical protein
LALPMPFLTLKVSQELLQECHKSPKRESETGVSKAQEQRDVREILKSVSEMLERY